MFNVNRYKDNTFVKTALSYEDADEALAHSQCSMLNDNYCNNVGIEFKVEESTMPDVYAIDIYDCQYDEYDPDTGVISIYSTLELANAAVVKYQAEYVDAGGDLNDVTYYVHAYTLDIHR